jgi:L-ribulose-5-phosphate 4-epimerase
MKNINNRKIVFDENVKLYRSNLVIDSFGNVSGRDKKTLLIKPSGVDLENSTSNDIVTVHIKDGKYAGDLKPSSDTPTHLELYRAFPDVGGIAHTHSPYATAWAQAGKSIPCLGTTHADYWNGDVPITRDLTKDEIYGEYEKETGNVIIEKIKDLNIDPLNCPGILVRNHGPFTWGATVEDAVKHAELLEYIARLALLSISINPDSKPISQPLHNKHFSRKHGPDAYYGQDSD